MSDSKIIKVVGNSDKITNQAKLIELECLIKEAASTRVDDAVRTFKIYSILLEENIRDVLRSAEPKTFVNIIDMAMNTSSGYQLSKAIIVFDDRKIYIPTGFAMTLPPVAAMSLVKLTRILSYPTKIYIIAAAFVKSIVHCKPLDEMSEDTLHDMLKCVDKMIRWSKKWECKYAMIPIFRDAIDDYTVQDHLFFESANDAIHTLRQSDASNVLLPACGSPDITEIIINAATSNDDVRLERVLIANRSKTRMTDHVMTFTALALHLVRKRVWNILYARDREFAAATTRMLLAVRYRIYVVMVLNGQYMYSEGEETPSKKRKDR